MQPVNNPIIDPHHSDNISRRWFWLALGAIFIASIILRFWGLDRFNTMVFDEVYFANFANDYLNDKEVFDAHPPLGKYLIAIGIKLKGFNPFGYRCVNAFTGSFLPLLFAALAYRISHSRRYALLAALFVAIDGLILVESRYALLNIYLLTFGLLSHLCLLMAADKKRQRWFWVILTGIMIGATIGVKWNGLSFITALYTCWFIARLSRFIMTRYSLPDAHPLARISALSKLSELKLIQLFLVIPLLAGLTYFLIWQPHMRINKETPLLELHTQIYNFHKSYANRPEAHAYTSAWFTWPFMLRPVAYYYQKDSAAPEPNIYDVHALCNPLLAWFSTLSVTIVALIIFFELWYWRQKGWANSSNGYLRDFYLPLYLLIGYCANLFSWIAVSRFTFLYHYIPAAAFGFLTLAWSVDRLLSQDQKHLQRLGQLIILLVVAAFIFWLPIYLGLPLTDFGYRIRMWLPSWI